MNMNAIKIRVYKRLDEGTILLWNTDPLTPEQRASVKADIMLDGGTGWVESELLTPNLEWMSRVLQDGKTDTIMIKHDEHLNMQTGFTVRLTFEPGRFVVTLEIKPRDQHQGFVKAVRVNKAKGQPIYAYPARVIGLDEEALGAIKQVVKEAMKGD